MKTQITDQYADVTELGSARSGAACAFTPSRIAGPTSVVFACMLLATSLCLDKSAAAQQSSLTVSQTVGQKVVSAEIPVLLAKSIDSKKLKAGDEVDGKTAAILHLTD